MKTRIITGTIGIAVVLLMIFTSRYLLIFGILALIALMTQELMTMRERHLPENSGVVIYRSLSTLSALSFLASYVAGVTQWVEVALIFDVLLFILVSVLFYPRVALNFLPLALFDGVYIGFSMTFLLVIRDMKTGTVLLLFLLILIWSSDSFAYFTGNFLRRKHALAPALSPKKSIEGAIGGMIGAIIFGLIFNAVTDLFNWQIILWFAPVISIIGIFGDLFESMIKRHYGFKDSGTFLPGHGGFLDRFDSLLAVLPVAGMVLAVMVI